MVENDALDTAEDEERGVVDDEVSLEKGKEDIFSVFFFSRRAWLWPNGREGILCWLSLWMRKQGLPYSGQK